MTSERVFFGFCLGALGLMVAFDVYQAVTLVASIVANGGR